eukprot:scaffold8470_cov80-Cylindrotheca_fusiformis.AAC.1
MDRAKSAQSLLPSKRTNKTCCLICAVEERALPVEERASLKGTDDVFYHQQKVIRRRNCTQNMVWRSWPIQRSHWQEKSQLRNNQQKPNTSRA